MIFFSICFILINLVQAYRYFMVNIYIVFLYLNLWKNIDFLPNDKSLTTLLGVQLLAENNTHLLCY